MNNQNWDDIRFVLAVAELGSLNAAAARLGVTHATVMRRVAACETRYGRAFFEKLQSGYRVLPEAAPILRAMSNVGEAVLAAERSIVGADQSPAGPVRIASTDSLCQRVLPAVVARVAQQYPKIDVTLFSANTHHDLSNLSADIVIRPTIALGDGLSGLHAGDLVFSAYGVGSAGRKWLRLEGALSGSLAAKWMEQNIPETNVVGGADSFLVLQHLAAEGLGNALLPRIVGDPDARLHRLEIDGLDIAVPVWIACLEDFASTPRFALVVRVLAEELRNADGLGSLGASAG